MLRPHPSRPRALLGTLLAMVLVIALSACGDLGEGGAQGASCSDFATQLEAQEAANTPDGDDDGRYCERLPCPCVPGVRGGSGGRTRASTPPKAAPTQRAGTSVDASVTHVVDGDTLDAVLPDGTRQRVRLIGIDTPETSALRSGSAECAGQDATRAAEALARRWPRVRLTTDATQDAYDRYDRLLAYVVPQDDPGTTYQQQLLKQGWAKVYVYGGTPFERVAPFRTAAAQARAQGRGVWERCGGDFRRPNA